MPWKCEYCTFVNYGDSAEACEMCGVKKKPQPPRALRPRPPAPGALERDRLQLQKQQQQQQQQQQQLQQLRDQQQQQQQQQLQQQEADQQQNLQEQQQQQQQSKQAKRRSGPVDEAIDGLFQGGMDERTQLLEEILESERTYVDSLCVLVTHFLQPIEREVRDGSKIITEKKLQGIFSNVSQLLQLNVELLRVMELELANAEQLRKRANSISDTNAGGEDVALAITKAFKEIIPYFKMYSWYVNNYPTAVELLKHEQVNNKLFAKYLATQHAHEICRGLDVGAYLIMPVQRLCKYPLLFGRLLKETPPENSDYEHIKQVTKVVNDITEVVDLDRDRAERSLRGFEIANFLSLEAISRRLETKLHVLQPGRVFLGEWTCMISRSLSKRRSASEPQKQRTMFLFSDSLIIAKKGSKGYEARVWMSLDHVLLGDLSPSKSASSSKLPPAGGVSEPSSPVSSTRSAFNWTPKLIGSAKRTLLASQNSTSSTSSNPIPSLGSTLSLASAGSSDNGSTAGEGGPARTYTFSIINESSMTLARLPLARSRSRKSGVETFTFFFEDDAERRKIHTELDNAIMGLQETSRSRPRPLSTNSVNIIGGGASSIANSQSFRARPLSEGNFARLPRKTRSLSPPPAHSGGSKEEHDPYQSAFITDDDNDDDEEEDVHVFADGDEAEDGQEEEEESVDGIVPTSLDLSHVQQERDHDFSVTVVAPSGPTQNADNFTRPASAAGSQTYRKPSSRPPAPTRDAGGASVARTPSPRPAGSSGAQVNKRAQGKARPVAPTHASYANKARPAPPTKTTSLAPSADLRAISSSEWASAPNNDEVRPATPIRLTSRSSSSASSSSGSAVNLFASKPITVVQRPAPLALNQTSSLATSSSDRDSQVVLVDKWFPESNKNSSSKTQARRERPPAPAER